MTTGKRARTWCLALAFCASSAIVAFLHFAAAGPPGQPIPYNHKQHSALGLKCRECHTMADPGEMMGLPEASKCLTCHRSIKQDSPAIQKLAVFARENRSVPWVRIYEIPSFVRFSHRAHLSVAGTCDICHGPVAQRETLVRETDISMSGCMNCHRANKASLSCTYCHDERR
jgi:hypothetical protein